MEEPSPKQSARQVIDNDVRYTNSKAAQLGEAQKRSYEDQRAARFLELRRQGVLPGVAFAQVDQETTTSSAPDKPLLDTAMTAWVDLWSRRGITEARLLVALGRKTRGDVRLSDAAKMTGWTRLLKAGKAIADVFPPPPG